jgi:tmRNA-binding protein
MKQKKKVSCLPCKHYEKHNPTVKFTHACKKGKKIKDCTEKNKKANCRDFKPKN